MRRHLKHEENLGQHPPADFLVALYFRGNGWWEPPPLDGAPQESQPTEPVSNLPEFEP